MVWSGLPFISLVQNGNKNLLKKTKSGMPIRLEIDDLEWSSIYESSAKWLDIPFEENKIGDAIFQMDRDKALGLDGFKIVGPS